MTSWGREVARAQATTGSEEVVVASTAPGLQILSRVANSCCLISRSSATASSARSTSANASSEPAGVIRASVSSRASEVIRPLSTERESDLAIRDLAVSAFSWPRAARTTS